MRRAQGNQGISQQVLISSIMGSVARLVVGPIGRTVVRIVLIAVVAVAVAYLAFLRPMQMQWGSTAVERTRPMPGDQVIGGATFVATRAITIDASFEEVWPLIEQMGRRERFFVKGFEANRYMLWLTRSAPRLSWCWTLEAVGSRRTRLVTRVRFRHPWLSSEIVSVLIADVRNGFAVRDAMLDVKVQAESASKRGRTRP
jgi:hypothetical protein